MNDKFQHYHATISYPDVDNHVLICVGLDAVQAYSNKDKDQYHSKGNALRITTDLATSILRNKDPQQLRNLAKLCNVKNLPHDLYYPKLRLYEFEFQQHRASHLLIILHPRISYQDL